MPRGAEVTSLWLRAEARQGEGWCLATPGTASPFLMSQAENINERSGGEAVLALPPPQGRGFVTVTGRFTAKAADWVPGQPRGGASPSTRLAWCWQGCSYSLAAGCRAQSRGRGVNSCSRGGISNKNLLAAYSVEGKHLRSTQLHICSWLAAGTRSPSGASQAAHRSPGLLWGQGRQVRDRASVIFLPWPVQVLATCSPITPTIKLALR